MSEINYSQIDFVIKREGSQESSLIQVLNGTQEILGFLPKEALVYISEKLKVPLSRTYGIVTFYNFFKTEKDADHVISICMGTACYVKGANVILKKLETELNIKSGQITPDKKFSIREVRCIGACGMGPLISVDGVDLYGRVQVDMIPEILNKYR
ncbi:MAG TPA: NAD(P)H-dependent oxidoreductase subunit E [Caldisericia bacterium]|jgi:NADH-quinone oxidoreductase subunit E|nr:NAD(P)H-dependent oxidoreductase subunit E [Caldisericia bacterium]